MKKVRWLHISDLHFGRDSFAVDAMREGILALPKDIGPIDYLFITGDLRYGNAEKTDYPPDVIAFVKDLQTRLGVGTTGTFIVPGNHDVNRCNELTTIVQALKREYKTADGSIPAETLEYIQMRRKPFLGVYEQLCGREEPAIHYSVETDQFNIIHINTAIASAEDNEDGDLIIGTQLLREVEKTLNPTKPSIVLAHHPIDSLRTEEQQQLEIFLKQHASVLYLCGHAHVAFSKDIRLSRQSESLWMYACGTNMDIDPHLDATDMDVFVGEIDPAALCGYVQAYKWSKKNSAWIPDNEFSFPQSGATDGKHYFPPDARPHAPHIDQKSILAQYEKYIQYECGEIQLNGLPVDTQIGQRKFDLESLFVPLYFKKYQTTDESKHDFSSIRPKSTRYALEKIVPQSGPFRIFFLSGPGGGKTTLMKWIASVFAFPDRYKDKVTYLPRRDLFPIWIKCRDIDHTSMPTILDLISGIFRRAEMIVEPDGESSFMRLVHEYINDGKALLLIDGLDEINDDRDRMRFVAQIDRFVHTNQQINVIVTSRISGFSILTGSQFDEFKCYEILPFTDKDIEKLCTDWYKLVVGDREEVRARAKRLASTITRHKNIRSLASNPLMLTTLLLVERRVGRLPAKRVALYSEAIQVLLETWNLEAHEPIDLDEARYQLAYVAYKMMTEHKQIINRRDLIQTLANAHRELDMLMPGAESCVEFIKKVERRSALLVQTGYRFDEAGQQEAIYEFQHLTFQEYLAAYAIANKCYPGAKREDSPAALLRPYLAKEYMKEVTLLSASLLDRWSAEELVNALISMLDDPALSFNEAEYIRSQLLQIIVDEVALPPQKRQQIYDCCFQIGMRYSDIESIRGILEGKYEKEFTQYLKEVEVRDNINFMGYSPIISVLKHPEQDIYQHYLDSRSSTDPDTLLEALSLLDFWVWMDVFDYKTRLDKKQMSSLTEDLFRFAEHADLRIRSRALSVLRLSDLIDDPGAYSRYADLYIQHINLCGRVPFVLECVTKRWPVPNGSGLLLTAEAASAIETEISKKRFFSVGEYNELLTQYCFLIQYTREKDVGPWLDNIMTIRGKLLTRNNSAWPSFELADRNFIHILETCVANNPALSSEALQQIAQFIETVRDAWDTYRSERSKLMGTQPFSPDQENDVPLPTIDENEVEDLLKEIEDLLRNPDNGQEAPGQ